MFYLVATLIFVAAFILRFYKLDTYPAPIHQDELSNVYDAYCIAETSADRWGKERPVVLRAFGEVDYRPALYGWLAAASIKMFGYSITAGRLPSAIMGFLSLVFMFLTARKLGGGLFSILCLLFATLMPWHIIYSRLAHEGAMLPAFFLNISIYLWILAKERRYDLKYLILLGFTNGLAVNSYQSSKLIFLLFAFILTLDIIKNSYPVFIKKLALYYAAIIAGALPQLLFMVNDPEHFFSRARTTIISPGISYEYFQQIVHNILVHLSPTFLFFSFGTSIDICPGRLLLIECIFFYGGIFLIYRLCRDRTVFYTPALVALLITTALPASLTGGPFPLRASAMMALTPIFSAAGVLFLYRYITKPLLRSIYIGLVIVLAIFNSWNDINMYLRTPALQNTLHQNNLVTACRKLNRYKNRYNKVLMENRGNQAYIYVAAFCMTPAQFQHAAKEIMSKPGYFDWVTRIDKYHFQPGSDIENAQETDRTLMLLTYRTMKQVLIDSTITSSGNYYFYKGRQVK